MEKLFFIPLLISMLCLSPVAHAQSGDTLKTITLEVSNLHCDGDMPTIQKNLLNQEGIDQVDFTKRKKLSSMFTISYHTAATDPEQIKKALESTPGCDEPDEKPYRVTRWFDEPQKQKP